jgi:hypothetical protein
MMLCAGALPVEAAWIPDGVAVCVSAQSQNLPRLINDGAGGVIMVWNDERLNSSDIYAQRLDASGQALWAPNGVPVCSIWDTQNQVRLVSDGAGGAIVTWYDQRTGQGIYAQRVSAAGTPLWTLNGVAICSSAPGSGRGEPCIAGDGAGGAIISWRDDRAGNSDIYVQRVDANGNVLWAMDGVPICATAANQEAPRIAADGSGGAVIAWHSPKIPDPQGDIYAQRVDANGNPLWLANGVPVCTATGRQFNPEIITDASGFATIVWQDERSGGADVYAQRLDPSGNAQWAANGVGVCTIWNNQSQQKLAPDGSGGAIITWRDERISQGIYAQRLNALGVAQWTVDGIAVCSNAPGTGRGEPEIVADLSGGAIVSWLDYRSGTPDVYAQRVDANGNTLWMTFGAPVCTAPGSQNRQHIAPDGEGGAYMAWTSGLGSAEDIYAMRIGAAGSAQTIFVDPPHASTTCVDPITVTFRIDQMGNATQIRGFDVVFHVNSAVAVVANSFTDISEGSYLDAAAGAAGTAFYPLSYGGGTYGVSCAILGGATGATGDGDLFTVTLTAVTEATGVIELMSLKLRDVNNRVLIVDGVGGVLQVDCTPPTMEWPLQEPEGVTYHAPPVFNNFGFDDDVSLDLAEYRIDGGSWMTIFSGVGVPSYDDDGWILPIGPLADGPHTVHFRVKDDAGNWNGEGTPDTYDWDFIYTVATGVGDLPGARTSGLGQNYPNPFNPVTTIEYDVATAGRVTINIYDVTGALVRTLVDTQRAPGHYTAQWNGVDQRGNAVGSGVFFYRMSAPAFQSRTRQMVLLK